MSAPTPVAVGYERPFRVALVGAALLGALAVVAFAFARRFDDAFFLTVAAACALLAAACVAVDRVASAPIEHVVDALGVIVRDGGVERRVAWSDLARLTRYEYDGHLATAVLSTRGGNAIRWDEGLVGRDALLRALDAHRIQERALYREAREGHALSWEVVNVSADLEEQRRAWALAARLQEERERAWRREVLAGLVRWVRRASAPASRPGASHPEDR